MIASIGQAGGAEMLVRNLSREFAARGHVTKVAYVSDAASLGASKEFEHRYQEDLAAAGVLYEKIGAGRRKNVIAGAVRLRRLSNAFQPDILHIHVGHGLAFRTASLLRLSTVYTHHNIRETFPPALFRVFDLSVGCYVAICDAAARLLERHTSRPVEIIHNGVPADFAVENQPRRQLPRDSLVLSVGNLRPEKDHVALIEAATRLVPMFAVNGRGIRFRIAGEGSERGRLEEMIRARNLESYIELLGTRTDIASLMKEADLLVQPSRSEGLPITLLEAAMSGLPVVSTDVGGCSDAVEEGQNGHLVPPDRPELLAEAISNILSDEARYVAFSAGARRLGERFTLSACATAHLNLYEAMTNAARKCTAGDPYRRRRL